MAATQVRVFVPVHLGRDAEQVADYLEEVARQIRDGMTEGHVARGHYWNSDTEN